MLSRLLFATLFVSAALAAASAPARADCGTGYLERFDRRGEPFCLPEAKERANQLRQAQQLRRLQMAWRADLIRDRQDRAVREIQDEQRRRDGALN